MKDLRGVARWHLFGPIILATAMTAACGEGADGNAMTDGSGAGDPVNVDPPEDPLADMVAVTGGAFVNSGGPARLREQAERVIADFYLDREEVTVAEYSVCVAAGVCVEGQTTGADPCNFERADVDDHPVNCVASGQAEAYCLWAGKRLPSEWEFEWVARQGGTGSLHPWGDSPERNCDLVVMDGADSDGFLGCDTPGTQPVDTHPKGASPEGIQDLIGNVSEWTTDEGEGVACGGNYLKRNAASLRADSRSESTGPALGTGFRCARDI